MRAPTARPIALASLLLLAPFAACTGSIGDLGSKPGEAAGGGRQGGSGEGGAGGTSRPRETGGGSFHAGASGLRRLSRAELDASLRDLLFEEGRPASTRLPEENINHFYGFDNETAANRETSEPLVEGWEGLSGDAVRYALRDPAKRAKVVPCAPTGPGDAACMAKFVAEFGRRALRGPLDPDEQKQYEAFLRFGVEAGDFYRGVEGAVRAMLMSPRFLYRVELGAPVKGTPELFQLSGYELGSRLSFTLLGTTPDEALLTAAAKGELATPAGVRAVAERMMRDPRARERVHHFFAYWLGYADGLPGELAPQFLEETHALLDGVIFEKRGDFREIFLADRTFIGDKLRKHYADLGAKAIGRSDWVPYGTSGRRGILSHGAVLAAWKTGEDTSPTKRGRFVRMRLLCDLIPDPPPEVAVDVTASATECKTGPSGFFAKSHQGAQCKFCHDQMDPIGFGLEKYNVKGQVRPHDDGKPQCGISGAGQLITTVSDEARALDFNGPGELGKLLVESGKLERCLVQHLYRFAHGRIEDEADGPSIDDLHDRFQAAKRDLAALLVEMVSDPAFAHRRESK